MKTILWLFFLGVLQCHAQTTNAPASVVSQTSAIEQTYGDDPMLKTATQGLMASDNQTNPDGSVVIYYGKVGAKGNIMAWLHCGKLMVMRYPASDANEVRRLLIINDKRWANSERENSWIIPDSKTSAQWDGHDLTIFVDPVHYQTEAEAKVKAEHDAEVARYKAQDEAGREADYAKAKEMALTATKSLADNVKLLGQELDGLDTQMFHEASNMGSLAPNVTGPPPTGDQIASAAAYKILKSQYEAKKRRYSEAKADYAKSLQDAVDRIYEQLHSERGTSAVQQTTPATDAQPAATAATPPPAKPFIPGSINDSATAHQ